MIETGIETAIKYFIFSKKGWITKVQSGAVMKSYRNKFGQTKVHKITLADLGTPDMIGSLKGRFLGVEVKSSPEEVQKWVMYPKTPQGKESKRKNPDKRIEAQKETAERIIKDGGFFAIVCSVEDLESDLKKAGIL